MRILLTVKLSDKRVFVFFFCSSLQQDFLIYYLCSLNVSFPALHFDISADPHRARNVGPSAIRRQATAAQRDGWRLHALSLRLADLQTSETLLFFNLFK